LQNLSATKTVSVRTEDGAWKIFANSRSSATVRLNTPEHAVKLVSDFTNDVTNKRPTLHMSLVFIIVFND